MPEEDTSVDIGSSSKTSTTTKRDSSSHVLGAALEIIVSGDDLPAGSARAAARALLDPGTDEALLAELLVAWSTKRPSAVELAAVVAAVLASARRPGVHGRDAADAVAIGGTADADGIAVLSALTAASLGLRVAKSCGRTAAGASDCAALLTARKGPGAQCAASSRRAESHRFTCVSSASAHAGLARLTAVQRRLGVRSITDLAGPLANPIASGARLIGAGNPQDQEVVAEAARLLGHRRTWVVRARGGLAGLSTAAPNRVIAVERGGARSFTLDPAELPIAQHALEDFRENGIGAACADLRGFAAGEVAAPLRDTVTLNAAVLPYLAGWFTGLDEAIAETERVFTDGRFLESLHSLS